MHEQLNSWWQSTREKMCRNRYFIITIVVVVVVVVVALLPLANCTGLTVEGIRRQHTFLITLIHITHIYDIYNRVLPIYVTSRISQDPIVFHSFRVHYVSRPSGFFTSRANFFFPSTFSGYKCLKTKCWWLLFLFLFFSKNIRPFQQ